MKKILIMNFILVGLISFSLRPVCASDSYIKLLLDLNESFVTVIAINAEMSSPSLSVAQTESGRIVAAKRNQVKTYTRQGAGVIIHRNGTIVTNLHTIWGAQKVLVRLKDQSEFSADILTVSSARDLALIKIQTSRLLNAVVIADSNHSYLGEEVVNVGHSYLLNGTISAGHIRGMAKNPQNPKEIELLQTDIQLHQGDSGGPLLNRKGQLIGLVTAKSKEQEPSVYAVPSNKIKKLYSDYLK